MIGENVSFLYGYKFSIRPWQQCAILCATLRCVSTDLMSSGHIRKEYWMWRDWELVCEEHEASEIITTREKIKSNKSKAWQLPNQIEIITCYVVWNRFDPYNLFATSITNTVHDKTFRLIMMWFRRYSNEFARMCECIRRQLVIRRRIFIGMSFTNYSHFYFLLVSIEALAISSHYNCSDRKQNHQPHEAIHGISRKDFTKQNDGEMCIGENRKQ